MVRISYFAWVRDLMGVAEEQVLLPAAIATIGDLLSWLHARDERGAAAFADVARIRAALAGAMVPMDAAIGGADDVAFFPPVTGG